MVSNADRVATKKCTFCKFELSVDKFSIITNHGKKKLAPRCKMCKRLESEIYRAKYPDRIKEARTRWNKDNSRHRNNWLAVKRYGMSLDEYDAMLAQQGGVCAICRKPDLAKNACRMTIDHCHDTGKVRGLLCGKCNSGIGLLGDSLENLRSAVEYLKKHSATLVE